MENGLVEDEVEVDCVSFRFMRLGVVDGPPGRLIASSSFDDPFPSFPTFSSSFPFPFSFPKIPGAGFGPSPFSFFSDSAVSPAVDPLSNEVAPDFLPVSAKVGIKEGGGLKIGADALRLLSIALLDVVGAVALRFDGGLIVWDPVFLRRRTKRVSSGFPELLC